MLTIYGGGTCTFHKMQTIDLPLLSWSHLDRKLVRRPKPGQGHDPALACLLEAQGAPGTDGLVPQGCPRPARCQVLGQMHRAGWLSAHVAWRLAPPYEVLQSQGNFVKHVQAPLLCCPASSTGGWQSEVSLARGQTANCRQWHHSRCSRHEVLMPLRLGIRLAPFRRVMIWEEKEGF